MLARIPLAFCLLPALFAQDGATVEGTVSDGTSRAGLPAVTVKLTGAGARQAAHTAVTDTSGSFRITGVPPGDYSVSYSREGYTSLGSPPHVVVPAIGAPSHLKGELMPLGALGGRILDQQGHPIPNVMVRLSTASRVSHMLMLRITNADKEGRYRFQKLDPGAYFIEAVPIEPSIRKDSLPAIAPPASPNGERRMWANTYYPGVLDSTQAGRVSVQAGWDLPGYDISLLAVPVFRVSGVVFGLDGKPAAGVNVGIELRDRLEHDSDGVKTRDDGIFEFPAVHQGDWRLMAFRRDGDIDLRGFAEAAVGRHDLENIVLRLSEPFTVSGVLEFEGAADRDSHSMVMDLESATHGWSATGAAGADGSFHIKNVPQDRYKILANGRLSGYYLASVLIGGREVMGQEVELASGAAPLRVIFKLATGRVQGSVENGAGMTVVLIPRDESLMNYQFIRFTRCANTGRFEIAGLRPGGYYAMALADADINALEDPDFVRTFAGGTTPVEVDNGLTVSLDLKVSPWPR